MLRVAIHDFSHKISDPTYELWPKLQVSGSYEPKMVGFPYKFWPPVVKDQTMVKPASVIP